MGPASTGHTRISSAATPRGQCSTRTRGWSRAGRRSTWRRSTPTPTSLCPCTRPPPSWSGTQPRTSWTAVLGRSSCASTRTPWATRAAGSPNTGASSGRTACCRVAASGTLPTRASACRSPGLAPWPRLAGTPPAGDFSATAATLARPARRRTRPSASTGWCSPTGSSTRTPWRPGRPCSPSGRWPGRAGSAPPRWTWSLATSTISSRSRPSRCSGRCRSRARRCAAG
mmetsp:Transcript_17835/g.58295  ORF Transcript_17835/g.58295 Transcript_17835/m.58295 type:complete len:228 (+) Transcript_17835:2229-2912(+)